MEEKVEENKKIKIEIPQNTNQDTGQESELDEVTIQAKLTLSDSKTKGAKQTSSPKNTKTNQANNSSPASSSSTKKGGKSGGNKNSQTPTQTGDEAKKGGGGDEGKEGESGQEEGGNKKEGKNNQNTSPKSNITKNGNEMHADRKKNEGSGGDGEGKEDEQTPSATTDNEKKRELNRARAKEQAASSKKSKINNNALANAGKNNSGNKSKKQSKPQGENLSSARGQKRAAVKLAKQIKELKKAKGIKNKVKQAKKLATDETMSISGSMALKWAFGAMPTLVGFLPGWLYIHIHIVGSILAPWFSEKLAKYFVKLSLLQIGTIIVVDFILIALVVLLIALLVFITCFVKINGSILNIVSATWDAITGESYFSQCFEDNFRLYD